MMQTTIKKKIAFSGVGLHTGTEVGVEILPAKAGSGISFVRTDIEGSKPIPALAANVVDTSYATTLGRDGATVSTVEHLMAAFYCMGLDNAVVELNGPEVPIMDGSAALFVDMIEEAGMIELKQRKEYIVIRKPVKVTEGNKSIHLLPCENMELSIDYSIDFSHPFLTKQSFSEPFSKDLFVGEVLRARTFGFLRDVEMLRANGLAKGGCLSNAVVIGDTEILNKDGLRYPDEFVRHKVLDVMGDLALLGAPVIGRLSAYRSGHALNHRMVRKILKNNLKWDLTEKPFTKKGFVDKEMPYMQPQVLAHA